MSEIILSDYSYGNKVTQCTFFKILRQLITDFRSQQTLHRCQVAIIQRQDSAAEKRCYPSKYVIWQHTNDHLSGGKAPLKPPPNNNTSHGETYFAATIMRKCVSP